VPAPAGAERRSGVDGRLPRRTRSLSHGVGQGLEVVTAGLHRAGITVEPDHLPPTRDGEAAGVLLAQVVGVRLGVGREWTDDRSRVGVDVGERRHRRAAAGGPRAAAQRAHGGDRTRRGPPYQLPAPKRARSTYASTVTSPRPTRRRDRRGRGLRGPLAPPAVPLSESPSQRFDGIVLDAVEHVEARWRNELSTLDFAVEEVPPLDVTGPVEDEIESAGVPLARLFAASDGHPARLVVYRRPLELRAIDRDDLEDLIHDIVVEEVARFLGLDPEIVDPGYGGEEPGS
jgi:predicted Zn-dependent protease with MMP-like domain